jgi:hypothetical protein
MSGTGQAFLVSSEGVCGLGQATCALSVETGTVQE